MLVLYIYEIKRYSCAILFIVCLYSEPAAQSDGNEEKKITKANKRLFRILKMGPDEGSLGGSCFPIHRSSAFLCPTAEG